MKHLLRLRACRLSIVGRILSDRRGAGLVEYALVIAGVALVAAGAVSIFGTKTSGIVSAVAVVLPGAQAEDNASIVAGQILETHQHGTPGSPNSTGGGLRLDIYKMRDGGDRLVNNLGVPVDVLIIDPNKPSNPGDLND